MKSILIQTVVLSIMVRIGAYRLPGLGHFRKSNEPHPTIEIGKFFYSLRNVHDLFKTSSNRMQGTRDGPTIPPSSQMINEGKTVISIGASEKKRSSRSQFFFRFLKISAKSYTIDLFFSFFTSKSYTNPTSELSDLKKVTQSNIGTYDRTYFFRFLPQKVT